MSDTLLREFQDTTQHFKLFIFCTQLLVSESFLTRVIAEQINKFLTFMETSPSHLSTLMLPHALCTCFLVSS